MQLMFKHLEIMYKEHKFSVIVNLLLCNIYNSMFGVIHSQGPYSKHYIAITRNWDRSILYLRMLRTS